MENEPIEVRTVLFNGLSPVCIINYQGAEYVMGKRRVIMTKTSDLRYLEVDLDQLPDAVQREYMVWRLST